MSILGASTLFSTSGEVVLTREGCVVFETTGHTGGVDDGVAAVAVIRRAPLRLQLDLLQLGARQWLIKRMEVLVNIAIFELQRHFKEVCEGALQFISAGNYL